MITKTKLKEYEFNTIEDYFNYIVESKINGNFSQVKNLLKELDKEQKKYFIQYLNIMDINKDEYINIFLEDFIK